MDVINQEVSEDFAAYHGDCVEVVGKMPDGSVDFTIYSPPFASLYTYSNSDRDMGNVKDDVQFFAQFRFLSEQLYRVTAPGRLMAVHCMNMPTSKARDGYIGIRDFRGDLIRCFEQDGWIYHSEVCIWKDPVVAMQRTKALGLLHKQLCKDSSLSRMGIPDYLIVMRKPGDNEKPISGELKYYVGDESVPNFAEFVRGDGSVALEPAESGTPIDIWQRYASPIWSDIRQTRTLQYMNARDGNDERHICPLQLDVIERAMQLWSRPGDRVLSPFMGIGSEGHVAIQMGRKFVGVELKDSYFNVAVRNLRHSKSTQTSFF